MDKVCVGVYAGSVYADPVWQERRRKRQVDLWTGGGWKSGSHGADGGIYVPQGTVGHGFQCDEESGTVFVDRAGRLWVGWIRSHKREDSEQEPVHPAPTMDRRVSGEFCSAFPQLLHDTPDDAGDRQRRVIVSAEAGRKPDRAAGQIREMGSILEGAMERIYGTKEDVPLEQEIGKRLRFMGITLIQVFFYSPGGRKRQVYVTMHTKRKICVPVKKVAAVLSELTDCEMMPARDSRTFVSQEKVTVLFVEATAYQVLYGIKKVTKPGEAVSGDNFSVFWLPEGRFVAGLSDGMGSGLQACGQSETVLDLMEQFLEAGFSRETAVRMINSSIVLQPEPHIFSTVDLASIDLYTGICEFLKIGSAASFIRRERNVECIRGTGLPAGISSELPLDPYRVRIYDGNLLFLMTDGCWEHCRKGGRGGHEGSDLESSAGNPF